MLVARVIAKLELGGTQLGALRLSRALRPLGIETKVLAGEAEADCVELFRSAGFEPEVWGGATGLQYGCEERFAAWLAPRVRDADIVHGHMFGAWWAATRAAPEAAAVVGSEHNRLRWPGEPPSLQMRRALRRVDAFFFHSPTGAEDVLAQGLPAERLHAGRSAIELDHPPQAHSALGCPAEAGRVLFAGRLHHEKGPDLLVEALARLPRSVTGVLIGQGPEEQALRRRIAELGIAGRVEMPGWQEDVGSWLAGADALVVPSRHEAWSQSAILAMAVGVPVIGTAVEGLPLTLGDGRGVLVAPEDPAALAGGIGGVLAARLRPDLVAARRYASRFTESRVARYYAEVYREVARSRAEEHSGRIQRRAA